MEGLTWNPARQCTGTNRAGERCQRQPIPGGTVCVMHGGAIPQVQAAAKARLVAMVEPVLGAFEEIVATWRGTRCDTCGRPTGDPGPVIQVGRLVLDRAGFHPTLTVEQVAPPPNPHVELTDDGLLERAIVLLGRLLDCRIWRRRSHARDEYDDALVAKLEGLLATAKGQRALPAAQDAELVEDDFVVPEDEPAADAQIPSGNGTPEKGTTDDEGAK